MPIQKPVSKHAQNKGESAYNWKGDKARDNTKRKRARTLYEADYCEQCNSSPAERHHKDSNTGNNAPDNIAILCRRCHMLADGRMVAFIDMARKNIVKLPPRPCKTCGCSATVFWHGECHKCNEFRRRNGVSRPPVENVRVFRRLPKQCPTCDRVASLTQKYGVCMWCYRAAWAREKKRITTGFIVTRTKLANSDT